MNEHVTPPLLPDLEILAVDAPPALETELRPCMKITYYMCETDVNQYKLARQIQLRIYYQGL